MARGGLGGRLPLLPPAALEPAARDLRDRIVATRGGRAFRIQTDAGELIGPFNACLHAPAMGAGFLAMHEAETRASPLSARLREVVILSVGAVWRSDYALYAHRAVAAQCGLPQRPIDNLAAGEEAVDLTEEERAVQRLTLELTRDRRIGDVTYAACERALGRERAVAVVFLAAAYIATCTVLNAFAVPAPAD